MSLLLVLGELSKQKYVGKLNSEARKLTELRNYLAIPPLERFVRLYQVNDDDNLFRFMGLYNNFLEQLSGQATRQELKDLDYQERYSNHVFSALKTNSDAFSSEVCRFLQARRGQWSDRFFEYILL